MTFLVPGCLTESDFDGVARITVALLSILKEPEENRASWGWVSQHAVAEGAKEWRYCFLMRSINHQLGECVPIFHVEVHKLCLVPIEIATDDRGHLIQLLHQLVDRKYGQLLRGEKLGVCTLLFSDQTPTVLLIAKLEVELNI